MRIDINLHNEDLPDDLGLGDKIAIDCEFMGLNVERDKLCLVQISTGKNDAHIVRLNRNTYNSPNLKKVLSNKKINKVFHYARADLLFIKKYLEIDIDNVDCTKIMSKIARSYSDKHGLKDLIREFTGSEISKNLQSSDFGGELSEKQLQYCAKDVIYLHKIFNSLKNILVRENRYEIYTETIKFLKTRVNLDLASYHDDIWAH
tara:strand:+ start:183 stop:794 length:612 start_codon:yes stop_codon:yes gene_type:complete